MREILFRGKRKVNKEWAEGYAFASERTYIVKEHPRIYLEVDPETLCQYTGLKDINGNKIFEGDVVKHFCCELSPTIFDVGTIYVDYEKCAFMRTSCDGQNYRISADCKYEIIGNIYDSPELAYAKDQL